MFGRIHVFRASWTLIDQGVVSVGSFAVNIVLARLLPAADYGTFAIIFGTLLMLQVFNTTLVFYPLTIRIAAAGSNRHELTGSSLVLLIALLTPLSVAIAVGLLLFGEGELVVSTVAWFIAWQLQEMSRRVLFSEFRHRAAVIGDGVSYLGQALGVILLAIFGGMSLTKVFLILAATSALGGCIQVVQIHLHRGWDRPEKLVATAKDYWSLGSWSLASSLTTAFRVNALIWLIGIAATRVEVADFQAALNVVNVVNPILVGLCNIIPQTAAQASDEGVAGAWRASRHYAWIGFVPTLFYYAFIMASPETMLAAFYGSHSKYTSADLAVQILSVAFILNYVSEMVCSFLHGISLPRIALNINLFGSIAVVLIFVLLFPATGWMAATIALAVAHATRLFLSLGMLKRLMANADVPSL
jgi:O-antigen/teichoic acid export membrane protein